MVGSAGLSRGKRKGEENEMMQEKFTEKIEQVHTAYQKMAKKCQMMQQEIESLTKDNQELQEKFAEKSRSVSTTNPLLQDYISLLMH